MEELKQKLSRVKLLVNDRQKKLDDELVQLGLIRKKYQLAWNAMTEKKFVYLEGVERLNQERASVKRGLLGPLEDSLDHAKREWMRSFAEVQSLEQRERAQTAKAKEAQKALDVLTSLSEKYELEFRQVIAKQEQKFLDDYGLRQFKANKQA